MCVFAGVSVVESRAVMDVSNLTELIPFVVQHLDCSGNESSLRDCQFSTVLDRSCSNQSSTASVQCIIQGNWTLIAGLHPECASAALHCTTSEKNMNDKI